MLFDGSHDEWTLAQLFLFFGPKVFFAILCGGLVGLEREIKGKAAGMKTNILICLGASLYTAISVMLATTNITNASGGVGGDPARLAAQIVSGIGFIGGGAIIQSRGTVVGMTTAATIWLVAAIGVLIGMGRFEVALVTSISTVLVLILISIFEDKVLGRSQTYQCEIVIDDTEGTVRTGLEAALKKHDLNFEDIEIEPKGKFTLLRIRYQGYRDDHKKFLMDLWTMTGVREVSQS